MKSKPAKTSPQSKQGKPDTQKIAHMGIDLLPAGQLVDGRITYLPPDLNGQLDFLLKWFGPGPLKHSLTVNFDHEGSFLRKELVKEATC